jgi:hypothetical protein
MPGLIDLPRAGDETQTEMSGANAPSKNLQNEGKGELWKGE